MGEGSWYSTGFDRAREIKDRREEAKDGDGRERFWVAAGKERRIVFLDDFTATINHAGRDIPIVPFGIHEHKMKLDGDFKHPIFSTCSRGMSECILCEKNFRRQFVGAMTILDITPYTNSDGDESITPRKKLMVAVADAILLVQNKKEKRGNLIGACYDVARLDKRHPRVGSSYEFIEQIDDLAARFQDVDFRPFGLTPEDAFEYYKEIFAPMETDAINSLFSSHSVEDGFLFRGQSGGNFDSGGGSSAASGSSGGGAIAY